MRGQLLHGSRPHACHGHPSSYERERWQGREGAMVRLLASYSRRRVLRREVEKERVRGVVVLLLILLYLALIVGIL